MIKTLTKHGNSAVLVIERSILDQLGATVDTPFEVVTDGRTLVLKPLTDAVRQEKFVRSMEKIGKRYAKSFQELAK